MVGACSQVETAGRIAEEIWLSQLDRLRGAYTDGTLSRAARSFRFFQSWCARRGVCSLPAEGGTVGAFLDDHAGIYAPRTMRSYLQGIRHVHLAMGLESPLVGEAVRLARLRHLRASRRRPRRIDVTPELLDRLLLACTPDLKGFRDRALLRLAFDTFSWPSELVLFRVEDLTPLAEGGAALGLRRRRDGLDVVHATTFLSAAGLAAVSAWTAAGGLASGPILRRVRSPRTAAEPMKPQDVVCRLYRLAAQAGIARDGERRLSCHGFRVGAAQALAASGRSLVQVMRAGRWQSVTVPAGYLREASANVWACGPEGDAGRLGAQDGRRLASTLPAGSTDGATMNPSLDCGRPGPAPGTWTWRGSAPERIVTEEPPSGQLRCGANDGSPWREALERLRGAYSDNTVRTYIDKMSAFQRWCDAEGKDHVPAAPATVADFCERAMAGRRPETVIQHLNAIRRAHRLLGFEDPTRGDIVLIARRRAAGKAPEGSRQALGIDRAVRDRLLAVCGEGLPGLRNRGLVHLGFDTLCRGSELVALRIEDVEPAADGTARILVRRSKTDRFGRGEWAYVSQATLAAVSAWLAAAGLTSGPLLRDLHTRRVGEPLEAQSVCRAVNALARRAGFADEEIRRLNGHSFRVGGARELATSGATLLEIMRAGRWRTVESVALYVRRLQINAWVDPDPSRSRPRD